MSLSALTALAVVTDIRESEPIENASVDQDVSSVAQDVLFSNELGLREIDEEAPLLAPVKREWTYSRETLTELTQEDIDFAEENIFITQLDIPTTYKTLKKTSRSFVALGLITLVAGLVFHPLLIASAVFFICAIGCKISSMRQRTRTLDYVRFQIKEIHEKSKHQKAVYERNLEANLHADRSAFVMLSGMRHGVERNAGQLLNRNANEEFIFTPEQLLEDIQQNNFFSTFEGQHYPYTISGIESVDGELYQDAIIRTCVEAVLGSEKRETPLQRLEKCACGRMGDELQDKALQLAAFFKMLGQAHQIVPTNYAEIPGWDPSIAANVEIADYGVLNIGSNLVPRAGQLSLSFVVDKEILPLCLTENFETMEVDDRPNLAVFRTVREYSVDPVGVNGTIRCVVRRKFIGTEMTSKPKTADQSKPQFFNRFRANRNNN